jgi:hypothetical protein
MALNPVVRWCSDAVAGHVVGVDTARQNTAAEVDT